MASSKRRRAIESGFGAKSSGVWTSPSASGSSATSSRSNSSPPTRSKACSARPRSGTCCRNFSTPRNPYGPDRRSQIVDPPPEQVRGAVEPRMLDAARMQRPRDPPGGEERCRPPFLRLPPGCVRPPLDRRLHERRAALGGRVGCEPLTCACDKLLVPHVGLVERAQRHRDCGRLAVRPAPVRLERVTESAVGVAKGGDRVADRSSVSAGEEPLEATTVEDPGVPGEKPGGGVDVRDELHASSFLRTSSLTTRASA